MMLDAWTPCPVTLFGLRDTVYGLGVIVRQSDRCQYKRMRSLSTCCVAGRVLTES